MDSEEGFADEGQGKTDDLSTFDFDLLTGSGDGNTWCGQCKIYQQEKESLEKEYVQKFNTLKKKIISTDLLIKKYKKKCEDYDVLSKEVTDSNNKKEQYRRESEVLKTQLTSALTQLEPTKRSNVNLETELKMKHKEIQDLKDKLSAQEVIQRQYNQLNTSTSDYKQRIETMQKEHSKTVKDLELRYQKQESQLTKLKEEVKSTKTELASTRKAQTKDASNLKKSVSRLETYFSILKDNGLLPKGHKRLRVETYFTGTESMEEELSLTDSRLGDDTPETHVVGRGDEDDIYDKDEEEKDDNDDSFMSTPWTFSPLVNILSPLPPTPKPHKDDSEEEEDAVSGSGNSIDDMADQLENELLNLPTSREISDNTSQEVSDQTSQQTSDHTSDHTSRRERYLSSPLSPIALCGQSTGKPTRSPLPPSLREKVLLKSNRKHMAIIENQNISASETLTTLSTASKENIALSVLGISENLSDSDEENKISHSNIIKCDKLVKHEHSAFIKFIKAESKPVENHVTDIVRTDCEDNVSVDKRTKSNDVSFEKRGLLRSDTGSFDLSELSEKCSENKESTTAKPTKVTTGMTEKADISDIKTRVSTVVKEKPETSCVKNGALTLSPNRPVTRTLTRSLSLSSDSLIDKEQEELSPGKRKTRAKTNNNNNPGDSAYIPVCSNLVPRLNDINNDTVQQNSAVTFDVQTADQTADICETVGEVSKPNVCSNTISEISEKKEVTNSTGATTVSRRGSVEKDTCELNKEVSFMRCKGRSKIPTGKSLKESFISAKEPNIQVNNEKSDRLSPTQSINTPERCVPSIGRKRIAHKVKHSESQQGSKSKSSLLESKEEECHLKEESSLHVDSMKSENDTNDKTCVNSEDDKSEHHVDGSGDKRLTRSMSRQCSTGFVVKLSPSFSGEKFNMGNLLDSILEDDMKEDQIDGDVEKKDVKKSVESKELQNSLPDKKETSEDGSGFVKEQENAKIKEDFEQRNPNTIEKEKVISEENNRKCSIDKNVTHIGETPLSENNVALSSNTQPSSSGLVTTIQSHIDPLVKSTTNTVSVSNSSITIQEETEKKDNMKCDRSRTENHDVRKSSPVPSSSKDLIYSPAVIVPSTSSLLKSTLNRSLVTSHSSGVVSPELASLSQRGADGTHSPPMTSMSPSSPVSPLPPSPFDFFLPLPISPLPPSPVRHTRPLSPLPGSPASSDTDSLPTAASGSGTAYTPLSDRSFEFSPACTPVSRHTPLAATPKHRDSAYTPPPFSSTKPSSSPLCSFHSKAPPDAITVRPHHGCATTSLKRAKSPSVTAGCKKSLSPCPFASGKKGKSASTVVSCKKSKSPSTLARCKRSLSPSFDDSSSIPDKSLKGEKLNKTNIKRKSVDSRDVPNLDVSKEKKPCLPSDKQKQANAKGSKAVKPAKDGVIKEPSTNQQKHSIEKELESSVNKYLFDTSISPEQITQQIMVDLKATAKMFINWLVQKLRCSEIELLSIIISHCEENGPSQPRTQPFLAVGEMRLLQLLNHLFQKTDWKSSKEKLLRSLWAAIFLRDVVTQAARSALCRIFTGVSKFEGDIEQVRVLFFHILQCGYLNGPLLAVTIAGVWPRALYRDNSGASPILVVMEHCLMQTMAENRQKYEKVVLCLMKLCDWSAPTHTTHALLSHLLNAIEEKTANQNSKDGVFELHRSLELLLTMQKPSFFKVHFTQAALKDLNGKITRGKKCNQAYICVILQIAAGFISSRVKELGQGFSQQSIRKYFIQILNNKSASQETKDCVLTALLEISYIAPMCIMTYGLHIWYSHNKDSIPHSWVDRMESTRKVLMAQLPKFKCLPFV